MKFSEHWLREWVSPALTSAELSHQVTMAGLEVDAMAPVAPEFKGVVVGEVLAVTPHPDAERLRVCQVNVGNGSPPLSIVCGAANVRAGLRVPAALVGATLPGGIEIKRAKLRGVESFGMLCSAKELGLAEVSEGLMVLPADAPIGADIRDYLNLNDVTFELGLTPNRGDCLSVAGVAREVAVLNRLAVTAPHIADVPATITDIFPITVAAPAACPRYVGRVIKGINPRAETPLWMRERLRRSGVRSISAVVDVTNYVLLELGQPMHAFDLAKLSGGIQVRHAEASEQINLLDGQRMTLQAGTLLIYDAHQPQAMAGIMGGKDSAIGDNTDTLFLESAFFSQSAVTGQARRYGLHTDSSHRFERGVDPQLPRRAMERATALLLEIVGGQAGSVTEVVSQAHLPARPPVMLRAARIQRLLGADIAHGQITDSLTRLGMQVVDVAGGWQVTPPSFRFDIALEADLIEEVARVVGYTTLPSHHPHGALAIAAQPEAMVSISKLRQLLIDRGYQEAITYSFVDPAMQRRFDPSITPLALANPISAEMAVMRTSLWPGLMQALIHNQNRQQGRIRLFEVGARFIPEGNETKEEKIISGMIYGSFSAEQWGEAARPVDFYDIKGDVEAILGLTADVSGFTFTATPEHHGGHAALHPGQSARITRTDNGEPVGWVGAIHPALENELGLTGRVFLFELCLAAIGQARLPRFRELSKYPAVRRDIALIVDEATSAQGVRACITEAAGGLLRGLLQEVQLFDVYRGKGVDPGRKSLALGLTWQDSSRTLTDGDIDALMEQVVNKLRVNLGAKLRD
jgi:phenylalanyl-tRNA synthetase beta chain